MTDFAHSGILQRRHSIPVLGTNLISQPRSRNKCPPIYFWMASSGWQLPPLPLLNISHNTPTKGSDEIPFLRPRRYPIEQIRLPSIGLDSSTWYSTRRCTKGHTQNDMHTWVSYPPQSKHNITYKVLTFYFKTENSLQSKEGQFIQIAPKDICQGMQHLEQYFQETINQGGEGIILRDPNSPNIPGRSPGYLKHKVGGVN